MVLGILTVDHAVSAQKNAVSTKQVSPEAAGEPIYNPYPAGILPPDLASEIERVRREVNGIFEEALAEALALVPPTLTGTLQHFRAPDIRPSKSSASC
jgi:hypothetical protein